MKMSRIKSRIAKSLTEACGYSPLTKVISEEEVNRILAEEEKTQTNADRIRSMTDEELAEHFDTVTKDVLGGSTWDTEGWLKWLREESEE